MAIYNTRSQTGGPSGEWHDDADLIIEIMYRYGMEVVPAISVPSNGTKVSWSGPDGNGNITFFDKGNSFIGERQNPGGEPARYLGRYRG